MIIATWIVGGIAAVIGLLAVGIRRQRRQLKRARTRQSIDAFTCRLQPLLERCSPGAVLAAHPNGRAGFLQVALAGRKGGWRELEFGLPDADWPHARFDAAVGALPEGAPELGRRAHARQPRRAAVPARVARRRRSRRARARHGPAPEGRGTARLPGGPDQTYNIDFLGRDHPDCLHATLDRLEHDPQTPRVLLRFLPMARRHVDEVERAMREAYSR